MGLLMKIPDKEKLFKELTDLITPEQEKEFFVLCELKKNPSFSTGGFLCCLILKSL